MEPSLMSKRSTAFYWQVAGSKWRSYLRHTMLEKFGEGDTEPAKGSFSDNAATAYTAQDIRFTTKVMTSMLLF